MLPADRCPLLPEGRHFQPGPKVHPPPLGSFCKIPSHTNLAACGFVLANPKSHPTRRRWVRSAGSQVTPTSPAVGSFCQIPSHTHFPPVGSFCRNPGYTHLTAGGFVRPSPQAIPNAPPVGSFCQILSPSHLTSPPVGSFCQMPTLNCPSVRWVRSAKAEQAFGLVLANFLPFSGGFILRRRRNRMPLA